MVIPNKDFRENPERAVYILGPIGQQMVHELSPQIIQLRCISSDPITAYIDSPGGNTGAAESIRNLITAPNQEGARCRLITVACGQAGSAAADFLAMGDYAIAYAHAKIVCHGVRTTAEGITVTSEVAANLAAVLQDSNEQYALQLARQNFPRIILRVAQLGDAFRAFIASEGVLADLVKALESKFLAANQELLRQALQKQVVIGELSSFVFAQLKKFAKTPEGSRFEAAMLKAIVNYRTRFHKGHDWNISGTGLREITRDFDLFYDFYAGKQADELNRIVGIYGKLFLRSEQLATPPVEQRDFLRREATPKLRLLWYFVVSLCRVLQTKDYHLTPIEAYWAGIIDEVSGSGLPSEREAIENNSQIVSPTPATGST